MEVLNLLKFWRNPAGGSDDVNVCDTGLDDEDSSLLAETRDFDKFVSKNKSSIFSTRSVGITSSDNDINKHHVHKIFSKKDGQARPSAFNANLYSKQNSLPLETNFKSQSPILILNSSPKNCISMLGFKKSSSSGKIDLTSTTRSTASPKIKESKKCIEEVQNTEDSSSSKYLKVIKPLYVKALKIKIFEQPVPESSRTPGAKQGSRAAVFREVCKKLMKSKSSVRTVPVPAKRRDDSALQQQDGIQSAILYCKRSYSSASTTTISQECAVLSRSASESSCQNGSNKSTDYIEMK
ncbi:hypothetical protein DCAR_0416396 [Daucus carota subsp. sativus]|uniref:Uncharacterized protein n=1 Tax=Daucus carota subsp. sativus TaxID=79200 RepID=A0A165XF81_DAUCS|nr:PREDICTED: probable membrane-associated kinase regulator 5 [Daucus carota subsp. sativus]WOG97057.1 hypothetical protein DCAR_0416396 [Daucus carota subsp. sativus]